MSKIEIEIPEGYYFDKKTMSVKKGPMPEFEYVDLGLPSGTKWATLNAGAEKDTDFGDYLSFESAQKYNCPSKEQIDELVHNTTSLWITKNDVNGRLFIGKNGNYIFIPAAGCRHWNNILYYDDVFGYYWSSTPVSDNTYDAYSFIIGSDTIHPFGSYNRSYGSPVRPVLE